MESQQQQTSSQVNNNSNAPNSNNFATILRELNEEKKKDLRKLSSEEMNYIAKLKLSHEQLKTLIMRPLEEIQSLCKFSPEDLENLIKFFATVASLPEEERTATLNLEEVRAKIPQQTIDLITTTLSPEKKPSELESYQQKANTGDPTAQLQLGNYYSEGKLVEKNLKTAFEWYEKSAKQGNATAQRIVAECYGKGLGVEKEFKKGVEWIEKSAKQGDPIAQWTLGDCYRMGAGVKQNLKVAIEWYEKSAKQDNKDAQHSLGDYHMKRRNFKTAIDWYEKAAERGHPIAQCTLLGMYDNGIGTERNLQKVSELCEQLNKAGYSIVSKIESNGKTSYSITYMPHETKNLTASSTSPNTSGDKSISHKKRAQKKNKKKSTPSLATTPSGDPSTNNTSSNLSLITISQDQAPTNSITTTTTISDDSSDNLTPLRSNSNSSEILEEKNSIPRITPDNNLNSSQPLTNYFSTSSEVFSQPHNSIPLEISLEADAKYRMGFLYTIGYGKEGIGKNLKRGREWLEEAAKSQHPLASSMLGRFFYNNTTTDKSAHPPNNNAPQNA